MVGKFEKIGQQSRREYADTPLSDEIAFFQGGVCPMHDDVETREIGKLIDAGHPELATKVFQSRWRYRWLTRLASMIPVAAAVVWHFIRQ